MKRELLSDAFGDIEERFVLEAYCPPSEDALDFSERIVSMKRRIVAFALCAVLVLGLGISAYAAWNVHSARQQDVKAELKIDENHVNSYVEYDVSDGVDGTLVLLSAVSDGEMQRVYIDISPVSEAEAAAIPVFTLRIDGTNIGGSGYPLLPAGQSYLGQKEISDAVLQRAYDKETQTLTLECFLDVNTVKQAMETLGTDAVDLSVQMFIDWEQTRSFGPVSFVPTEEQSREFDFDNALYNDAELGVDIEIVALELTPFSAVWKVHYEGDSRFHAEVTTWEAYEPWANLEDRVCKEAVIRFSDGTEFSTGGVLNGDYENGTVNLWCSWECAIDIEAVWQIVLGDLILWEAE